MTVANSFHTVRAGDTLSKIAASNGTTITELKKINGISNVHRIDIGQRIALKREAVCGARFQFLDAEHNPVKNLGVQLEYNGKLKKTNTGENGHVSAVYTDSPEDRVKIWVERVGGGWKLLGTVQSEWGNKLVTIVLPKVKIPIKTAPHPKDERGQPLKDAPRTAPAPQRPQIPAETKAQGTPHSDFGDQKGTKSQQTSTSQGLPLTKVSNDQARPEFLGEFTGETIKETDYQSAAYSLGTDPVMIKLIAEQETKKAGRGPFDAFNRPSILFERHYFSRLTQQKYDLINPDISSQREYTHERFDAKGNPLSEAARYSKFSAQYPRLMKAYALHKNAALSSCSWGTFQIMGANFRLAGFTSVDDFVKAMSKSERSQLDAFVHFVNNDKRLLKAMQEKDWETIARKYNGPKYKRNRYDEQLRRSYERIKLQSSAK